MTDIELKQKIDDFIYENITGDILAVKANEIFKDIIDYVNDSASVQSLDWNPVSGILGLTGDPTTADLKAFVLGLIPDPDPQYLNLNNSTGELQINSWGNPINIKDYVLSIIPAIAVDGITITGDGTPGNPLVAASTSGPPAIGMGAQTFNVNFNGTSGQGQVGTLIIPIVALPTGCFIAEVYVDTNGGSLVGIDETAYITMGIGTDDETSALDETVGLVTSLNANGVTKITTPSLSKATANRVLVADVGGSNIVDGSIRVIIITSDALAASSNDIKNRTVAEMQSMALAANFEPGQLYCITDAPQCPSGLNIRAFDESTLEAMGSGPYKNTAMGTNDPMHASIWYDLANNAIHRVYEQINNNDVSTNSTSPEYIDAFNFSLHSNNTFKNVEILNYTDSNEITSSVMCDGVINFNDNDNTVINNCILNGGELLLGSNCNVSNCRLSNGSRIDNSGTDGVNITNVTIGYESVLNVAGDGLGIVSVTIGKSCVITTEYELAMCMIGDYKTFTTLEGYADKMWVGDKSTFESTMDITGITTLDLASRKYCGVIYLTSTNASETIDTIDGVDRGQNFRFIARADTGVLAVTFVGETRNTVSPTKFIMATPSLTLTDDASVISEAGDWIAFRVINNSILLQIDAQSYI